MAEDDDGDSGRGDGGDLIGLLPPPPSSGSGMMEENSDSPTRPCSLLTDDVDGWDALQLVPLLPVLMVSGEQLPLPELCPPAALLAEPDLEPAFPSILLSQVGVDGGGLVAGHAVPPHDVELVRGGLGCMLVAGPVRHLVLLLCAGLELLLLLPACLA